jgi:ATP-binding cassette subfamily B protein
VTELGSRDKVDPVPVMSMRRRFRTLVGLFRSADRRLLAIIGMLILLDMIAQGALSLSLKWTVNGALSDRWTFATAAAVMGGLAGAVIGGAGRLYSNLQDWIAALIGIEVNRATVQLAASTPGIEHLERAEYLDQVQVVTQSGDGFVRAAFSVTDLLTLFARIAISVVLLASVHPLLIVVALAALPSVVLAPRAQRHIERATAAAAESRRAADHLHQLFAEPGPSMELRLFSCSDTLDHRADELWRYGTRIKFQGALRAAAVSAVGWIILVAGYVGAIAWVARQASHGQASAGDVILVAQLALQLRGNLAQTTASIRQVFTALRLADRFIWLQQHAESQAALFRGDTPAPSRIETGIRLDHVSFSYPGTDQPILRDISVHLPAGSTVAIVGDNGAGKTTLVKLLCRFYDPTSGTITVDDTRLTSLGAGDWSAHLSGSFQDYLRIESLARHSIGAGHPPNMNDTVSVQAALDRAAARDVIDTLTDGLDTHLGKTYTQGAELSGGQWQRLAIARGVMRRDPLLLILDEPTAALDAAAEQAVYERYAGAADRTRANGGIVVLVSHRFASVRMADLIVVLDHGTIAESGPHEHLIANGGPYARMFEAQAAAYR